jgi:hypothetical protein
MLTQKDLVEAELLKQSGVFDFSGGVAYIYRDPAGDLKAVKIELNTFRKGKVKMTHEQIEWLISIRNSSTLNARDSSI